MHADVTGNSFATLNPPAPKTMLAGHIDEIEVMVTHIDDDGYLQLRYDRRLGPAGLRGAARTSTRPRRDCVTAVVGKKAIHLMDKDDREKVSKVEDLWLDIGATNRAAAAQRIRIGDPGVLATSVLDFPDGRLISQVDR